MFKSYLKLAIRNLWKRKTSTFINVLSLATGLTACALVFLYFQHEYSFDKGFDNRKNVYRVVSNFASGAKAPTTAFPYATLLKNEVPEIEENTRVEAMDEGGTFSLTGKGKAAPYSEHDGYRVDPNFFNILSFHFLYGDKQQALNQPYNIVLSQKLAEKLFGNSYPIGQTVKLDDPSGSQVYTVSGVLKNDFLNHLNPNYILPNTGDKAAHYLAAFTNWMINPNFYTYIKVKPGTDIPQLVGKLNSYLQRHAAADMKATGEKCVNSVQALKDIHLHSSQYQGSIEVRQGNLKYLYLLGTIALIILLLGSINFMNLSTAQAIDRAREVGVRRVMGANRIAIRYQFFIETLLVSFVAFILAGGLVFLILPVFNQFTGQELSFFAPENRTLVFWMLLITLLTGLLSGIYPVFYLSSFKPVIVLKGRISNSLSAIGIRKVLVIAQFAISVCLIFATMVIWQQLHFMINSRTGYDRDQQVIFPLNSEQAKKNATIYLDLLAKDSRVLKATAATGSLLSGDMNLYRQDGTVNDKHDTFLNCVDANYIKTLGLQLIAGGNFSQTGTVNTATTGDFEEKELGREMILNEQAVKVAGLDPQTAVGKYMSHVHNGKVNNYKIVGVVKDYHFFSMHNLISPMALVLVNPTQFSVMIAKVNGHNQAGVIKTMEQAWKKYNPDLPFKYDFLSDQMKYDYKQDEQQQKMMGIFTGIAILISCMGLLGLITYLLAQKTREIGIRKVIGAGIMDIVLLFSGEYLKLIVIANCIALPIGWYIMDKWLQDFPYRTHANWWTFVLSLLAGLVVAFVTTGLKTFSAARANPVKSLRME
ncbi:MAG: FtsX-like permease family protein [Bacteroidota bacterium]